MVANENNTEVKFNDQLFFNKIEKTTTCWIWTGAIRGKSGYGCLKYNGKVVDAHRISYIIHFGTIPNNKLVCHTCDNRKCVNPDHLFLGTYKDNHDDCVKKGRIIFSKKKHPSIPAYKRGCRCSECTELVRIEKQKYRAKKKNKISEFGLKAGSPVLGTG